MLDLPGSDLVVVKEILTRHAPGIGVLAYGSRVTGRARRFSDLDLALETESPWSLEKMEAVRDAFSESDLPISVDLLDLSAVGDSFREIIRRQAVRLLPE